jgi:hypothetical protein
MNPDSVLLRDMSLILSADSFLSHLVISKETPSSPALLGKRSSDRMPSQSSETNTETILTILRNIQSQNLLLKKVRRIRLARCLSLRNHTGKQREEFFFIAWPL